MAAYEGVPCLVLLPYEPSEDKAETAEGADGSGDSSCPFKDTDFPSENNKYVPRNKGQPKTSSAHSLVKGYALLPRAFKIAHPEIIQDFARYHIRVISNVQDEPSIPMIIKKYSLKLFEAALSSVDEPLPYRAFPLKDPETSVRVTLHVMSLRKYEYPSFLEAYLYGDFFMLGRIDTTCFCKPMEQENLEVFKYLLRRRAKIDYGHAKGGTLLHFAVKRRQKALVELVLAYGADVEAERDDLLDGLYERTESEEEFTKERSNTRPLFLAAKKGFAEIVEVLLKHGAVHDAETYKPNYTPLEAAFNHSRPETFRLLLDSHVKTKTDSENQRTLSKYLRESVNSYGSARPALIDSIVGHCPSMTDGYNKTTFYTALLNREAGAEQMQCFEKLNEYGFKIDYNDIEHRSLLLFGAIVNDWVEEVRNLIEGGADVNKVCAVKDLEGLPERTSKHSDLALVPEEKWQWNPAADLLRSQKDFTPLHMAAAFAGEPMIKLLLEHGAVIDAKVGNRTPLHDACQTHNMKAVKLLIASKADVQHNTELMNMVVDGGNPGLVELLLLNRTPLTIQNSELEELLARAVARHTLGVMNILFRFGAQPTADFKVECRTDFFGSNHYRTLEALFDNSFTSVDFVQDVSTVIRCAKKSTITSRIYCSSCNRCVDACFDILARHVIKLESAGLSFRRQDISSLLLSQDSLVEFRNDCEAEVVRLKAERVGNLNATFYDILTKHVNLLATYARHKDFEETMNAEDYYTSFPIYANVISCQFEKGLHRRELLDRGVEICSKLSIFFKKLPDLVKEEVVKYLNNYNLELLSHEFVQFSKNASKLKA